MKKSSNFIDITGQKFNNLLIIEFSHSINKRTYWKCLCDCGVETIKLGNNIKCGKTKSCGCLRKSKLSKGETGLNRLFTSYKRLAKRRGIIFDIDKNQFKKLTQDDCYYCNISPNLSISNKYTNGITQKGIDFGEYIYNGIDRKDSSMGYFVDNCVTCCNICNRAKSDMSYEDFINYINRFRS